MAAAAAAVGVDWKEEVKLGAGTVDAGAAATEAFGSAPRLQRIIARVRAHQQELQSEERDDATAAEAVAMTAAEVKTL